MRRISSILALVLISSMVLAEAKPGQSLLKTYKGKNVLFWRSNISSSPNISGLIANYPTIISFESYGGSPSGATKLVKQLRTFADNLKRKTGHSLEMYFSSHCDSACLIVLTGMNQSAKSGSIKLTVYRNTRLGFHGAYYVQPDGTLEFNLNATKNFVDMLTSFGMNLKWVAGFPNLFAKHDAEDVLYISAGDPRMIDSGIVDDGVLSDGDVGTFFERAENFIGEHVSVLFQDPIRF